MSWLGSFDPALSEDEDVFRRRAGFLYRLHVDGTMLLLLLLIALVGLVVLYSAGGRSWDLVFKQGASFGIGLCAMLVIAQLEPRFMARWVPLGYLFGVLLLLVVDVMGHNAMGATRWINIPGVIRFQPAELMKILMPATVAWYLSNHSLPAGLKHTAIALVLILIPFVLIVRQPDLGTALLVLAAGAFVLFIGGLRWIWIGSALAAVVPVAIGM